MKFHLQDQEVDIDRVHHDEERRQGLSIQVFEISTVKSHLGSTVSVNWVVNFLLIFFLFFV